MKNKKTYVLVFLVIIFGISIFAVLAKADGTYNLNPNQSLRKDFHGKEGEHYSWKIRLEIYGTIQYVILNDVQFENRELLIWESECYSISSMCGGDAGAICKGGFTVPYDDTWHVYWVNRGMYATIITLYDWGVVSKPTTEVIGINIIPFLLGFMCISVILIFKKDYK